MLQVRLLLKKESPNVVLWAKHRPDADAGNSF